jgi:hypothetical protein
MTERIRDVYYHICLYLELSGAVNYLSEFRRRFDFIIDDLKINLIKAASYNPDDDHGEIKLIHEFKRVLEPFQLFKDDAVRNEELTRIHGMLTETQHILEITRNSEKIIGEADIYGPVKTVLELFYPRIRLGNRAKFIKKFKTFVPDIIIPELKVGIEYKYLKKGGRSIDDLIDEAYSDSTNYTGDEDFGQFMMVLYLEDTSAPTQDAIKACWKEKKFPANWELVIAIGARQKNGRATTLKSKLRSQQKRNARKN